jgi:hypothetical protein
LIKLLDNGGNELIRVQNNRVRVGYILDDNHSTAQPPLLIEDSIEPSV